MLYSPNNNGIKQHENYFRQVIDWVYLCIKKIVYRRDYVMEDGFVERLFDMLYYIQNIKRKEIAVDIRCLLHLSATYLCLGSCFFLFMKLYTNSMISRLVIFLSQNKYKSYHTFTTHKTVIHHLQHFVIQSKYKSYFYSLLAILLT